MVNSNSEVNTNINDRSVFEKGQKRDPTMVKICQVQAKTKRKTKQQKEKHRKTSPQIFLGGSPNWPAYDELKLKTYHVGRRDASLFDDYFDDV